MRERWLAPTMAGDAMAAFAMTEPGAGSDVASLATRARRDGEHYVLDGAKCFISNAGIADYYTVFATTEPAAGSRGISCFVPADAKGFRFVGPQILSSPHPLGEIAFEGCRVPATNWLSDEGRASAGLRTPRPPARHGGCGRLHGRARWPRRRARAHATSVRQAASASSSQAEKLAHGHRADRRAPAGIARRTRPTAARNGSRSRRRWLLHATEAAQRIVDDAAGAGWRRRWAEPGGPAYARRALRIYEGTSEVQHLVIAGLLLKEAGA